MEKLVSDCERKLFLGMLLSGMVLVVWNTVIYKSSILYLAECMILAFYLLCMEVPNHQLQKIEDNVYRELLLYLSRVKHRYTTCHHMANSIMNAAEGMSYEIERLAEEMYRVLVECDRKEKVREYVRYHKTNRYLKLFLIQAYEVSEKGDMFFGENIEHLRLELMEELYRRKRRAYEFSGYIFVTIAPFFLMPVLRQWGLAFTPELEFFYAGAGMLLEIVTFVATVLIYGMILRAKEIVLFGESRRDSRWSRKDRYHIAFLDFLIRQFEKRKGVFRSRISQLLLKSGERTGYGTLCARMMLLAVCTFLGMTLFFAQTHSRERRAILEQVDTIETIAPVASEEKKQILSDHILALTKEYCKREEVTEEEVRNRLREEIRLGNESMEQETVKEIIKKTEQYKKTGGSVGDFFLCILAGAIMGAYPILRLSYQAQTIAAGAGYEVKQFQSVLWMGRNLQGATVVGLLEDMEVFSQCFKTCLRRCINSYGAGPQAALIRLKEEGSCIHEGFEELADAFLSVDEVGVQAAFEEVESNRRLLEKMTQLEAEIHMEKKKDTTELLTKIPMLLTVGAYFIFPFFSYSLQGVFEIFKVLEEMQM